MKERPILFSSPMIRAILKGRKKQTRRVVKDTGLYAVDDTIHGHDVAKRELTALATQCPYGQPGDRLWVRETWNEDESAPYEDGKTDTVYFYRATSALPDLPWRPSIFMPRQASRITLEITGVHVARLQDITEEDAIAEGVSLGNREDRSWTYQNARLKYEPYKEGFSWLWSSINAKKGYPWEANPWVWVIEFKRLEQAR